MSRQAPEFGLLDWRKVGRPSRSPSACHDDKEKASEGKERMRGLRRKLINRRTEYRRHVLNVVGRDGSQEVKAGVSELEEIRTYWKLQHLEGVGGHVRANREWSLRPGEASRL